MKPRVLMLNSAKKAPVDILCADRSIDLSTITERRFAHLYPDDASVRFVDDICDLITVRNEALDMQRAGGIDIVVAPTERSLQAAGYLRSYFGLPGVAYDQANFFSNKLAMKQLLRSAGISVGPFAAVNHLEDLPETGSNLGFPIVVKPAVGAGGVDTFVLESRDAAAKFAADATRSLGLRGCTSPILAERFIDMEAEYHIDSVVFGGEVLFTATSRYFVPLLNQREAFTGSFFLPAEHPDHVEASRLHSAIVEAAGLTAGVTHLELFKTGAGFLVGEITCRPGGGGIARAIELQYGLDLWKAFVDVSLGRMPDIAVTGRPSHGRMVANSDLPIRPGRILHITEPETLLRVPGMLHAEVHMRVGDTIADDFHTSSSTGVVYFSIESESALDAAVDAIAAVYRLETEPI